MCHGVVQAEGIAWDTATREDIKREVILREDEIERSQTSQGNHIRSQLLNALTLAVIMRLTTPSSLMSLGYVHSELLVGR